MAVADPIHRLSQNEPRIEQFIRQPNGDWLLRSAAGLNAQLELPSLNIGLALSDVFARVEFTPAPLRGTNAPSR
jgi:hypothetical protein